MALSLDDTIFVGLFNGDKTDDLDVSFTLDESRVMLIRQLLEIDQNLGRVHAKISGVLYCSIWFYNNPSHTRLSVKGFFEDDAE